jgi:hypothetical protein
MRSGVGSRRRIALAAMVGCLTVVVSLSTSTPAGATVTTVLGPVLSQVESSRITDLTDTGITVPLPNGEDLWVFGDLERYLHKGGRHKSVWVKHGFVKGSNAAEGPYTQGQLPTPLDNVRVGQSLSATNQPTQFIPTPTDVYMKNGSSKRCTKAHGAKYPARWATGAALMPDSTNVLVTYIDICVVSPTNYPTEGWGFMEYNWMENTISVAPTDVFPPTPGGATLPATEEFGSPIVANNEVTLFSSGHCPDGLYTTIAANATALANPASYVPSSVPGGFEATGCGSVERATGPDSQPELQLVWLTGTEGQFAVYSAPTVTGRWSEEATGTLPGCQTDIGCYSVYLHPEMSTSSKLLVSYVLPDYGPGVAGYTNTTLGHLVLASVPLTP